MRDLVAELAGKPDLELAPLGSGADFVPFQSFLGLPTLSLEFGSGTTYGAYHSSYDTRQYMEKFGDPGWNQGRALAELMGRAVLRLADAEVLPLHFSRMAQQLQKSLQQLEKQYGRNPGLETTRERLAAFAEAARAAERSPRPGREFNDHLLRAEKSFVDERDERWYRNTVYGWNIYALYSGQTLPALRAALERKDATAFAQERKRLEEALERAIAELQAAAR